MTQTTLMNWEAVLDAAGFCCCILTVLYLIRLKRKSAFKGRMADPVQQEDAVPFKAAPAMDLPADMPFDNVLATVKNDYRMAAVAGGRSVPAADPYAEVRRLLGLGMEPRQIADRIKIPLCEIDLIVSLRQIQPDPASDKRTENEFGAKLA